MGVVGGFEGREGLPRRGAAARGRTTPSTSLSAVRRKEAGRVETKESATVAMLARFLDEGEGARGSGGEGAMIVPARVDKEVP